MALCLSALRLVAVNGGEADADLHLGPLATYPAETAARLACGQGQVVWAERYAGYYYKPGEARYGVAAPGAYACARDAAAANYWSSDPMESIMNHPGKNFRWPDPPGS